MSDDTNMVEEAIGFIIPKIIECNRDMKMYNDYFFMDDLDALQVCVDSVERRKNMLEFILKAIYSFDTNNKR
jgi:hypothetical protein